MIDSQTLMNLRVASKRTRLQQNVVRFVVVLLLTSGVSGATDADSLYDIAFFGGLIVDGTGSDAWRGDVGIVDGRIAHVGLLQRGAARVEIDIDGLVLSPGFIDVHSHAELGLVDPELRANRGYITQGVTTTVFGVDGDYSFDAMQTTIQKLEAQGVGTNYMFYVGHNGVRADVMGMEDRQPTASELESMREQVRNAMEMGTVGLSSGLMYLPGRYAGTNELVELAREIKSHHGSYDSHIRDPADSLMESIVECLEIAMRAGVRAHPAHLKAVGKQNFGASVEIVDTINSYISNGLDVTSDVYPYDGAAARKLVTILIPPDSDSDPMRERLMQLGEGKLSEIEARETIHDLAAYWRQSLRDPEFRASVKRNTEEPDTGVFSWIDAVGYGSFRVVVSENPGYLGRMIVDIAKEQGKHPFDVIADLIVSEGAVAKITLGAIEESDLRHFLLQSWVMISSDGKITGMSDGGGHPRYRGSFPRVLGRYVREWKVLSLVEAVRKMTSLPANYLQLKDRGLIREGYWADISVFDSDNIKDMATWEDPSLYSVGVVHVLVNGKFSLRDEKMTDETHGRFLRRHSPDE